ncbi:hypothetical protein D3C86_1414380 [compost metagenome]
MGLRLGQCRLNQLITEPALADLGGHVHAKQRHLVPGLFPRLERKADDAGQPTFFERPEHHVQLAGQARLPPAQRHHRPLTHARGEGLRVQVVGFEHQRPVVQGMAGIQSFDPHPQAIRFCSSISRSASADNTKPMK